MLEPFHIMMRLTIKTDHQVASISSSSGTPVLERQLHHDVKKFEYTYIMYSIIKMIVMNNIFKWISVLSYKTTKLPQIPDYANSIIKIHTNISHMNIRRILKRYYVYHIVHCT